MKILPIIRPLVLAVILLMCWQLAVTFWQIPHYLLPTPLDIVNKFSENTSLLWQHTQTTLIEIVVGLVLGVLFGLLSAVLLSLSKTISSFLLPILITSQAIPIFAIAPLLVLWFGYGMASKIVMTILIIYFPVTAACYDGLRNTPKTWLELANTIKISPLALLLKVKFPAALPALASGLRIAVSIAPIGAVIGEWVGSSEGLGYLMLNANARMQVDLMFSALFILVLITLFLYFFTDKLLRYFIPWISQVR
ncbi:ABC transporter permease [Otariodibacter oris]|uniref:Putative hydroxymethylpyrimidine transport system permease protein n=1 Tax=Otariodibacter oris TaxID=1032623 RepID=A0A420XIM5_9PAST|nr:ABC transporter permease [Otariodibacter oris]QGM80645.1 ABC transporter permease [Otariodibacter oris]RKR77195.1 putative hydroxymethylpyrimidine transport system permease protein [Otariodibacter oris]